MGPPELPGGNASTRSRAPPKRWKLQWGRRNYPAETRENLDIPREGEEASMGPPELPGGNRNQRGSRCS